MKWQTAKQWQTGKHKDAVLLKYYQVIPNIKPVTLLLFSKMQLDFGRYDICAFYTAIVGGRDVLTEQGCRLFMFNLICPLDEWLA